MKNYRNFKHVASAHVGTRVLELAQSETPSLRGPFQTVSASDANRRTAFAHGFSDLISMARRDLTRREPQRREPPTPRESSAYERFHRHAANASHRHRVSKGDTFTIYVDPDLRGSRDSSQQATDISKV